MQCTRHGGSRNFACAAAVLLFALAAQYACALPPNSYSQHVFFDNAASTLVDFHSEASCVAPSQLEIEGAKLPVETARFHSAPNAVRIKWTSARGGDWRATLKSTAEFVRPTPLDGDTLSVWCYSVEGLNPDDAPRVFLKDSRGRGTPAVWLLAGHEALPAGKWVELRLPLSFFLGLYQDTDDERFDIRHLQNIALMQNLEDAREHTLLIDDVSVVPGTAASSEPLPAPTGLTAVGYERHVDLAWKPVEDPNVISYRVYRAKGDGDFKPVGTRPAWSCRYEDFCGVSKRETSYRIAAVDLNQRESDVSETVAASTRTLTDDQLLDMVQEGCFRFYWEAANPNSGMAVELLPGDENLVAMGASGFGIMAQIVATERKFISRDESTRRLLRIVRFLAKADRFHGAWPHFLNGSTGRVNPYFGKFDNGGDLVETAFMVQGLLAARQYFNRDTAEEREIRDTITTLWHEVEWSWYRKTPESEVLYWHWSPDQAWHISHPLIGWNETLIVYLLAIASPTHSVPASMYYSGWAGQSDLAVNYRRNWSRTAEGDHYVNGNTYYGIKLDVGSGSGADLFFTQFSFLGFDPRAKRDRYTNYFENNRRIALINRAYCTENPRHYVGYGPDCWGLSAGVNSGGGRPLPRDDNGTICTSAALGVFPYTPEESFGALRHFYRDLGAQIWGPYGFHDGFNETQAWFDEVYMGLNQAQIVVGIENHRSGLIWKYFMMNPEIGKALGEIGFDMDGRSSSGK